MYVQVKNKYMHIYTTQYIEWKEDREREREREKGSEARKKTRNKMKNSKYYVDCIVRYPELRV